MLSGGKSLLGQQLKKNQEENPDKIKVTSPREKIPVNERKKSGSP